MVVDLHVLYWWLEGNHRLSTAAIEIIREAEGDGARLLICSVTFWELAMKERSGQLACRRPVREWPGILGKMPWIDILSTPVDVWLRAAELAWKHRDPADRLIAATALSRDTGVLTKDRLFHGKDSPVEAVW